MRKKGFIDNCAAACITSFSQFSICLTVLNCHLTNAVIHNNRRFDSKNSCLDSMNLGCSEMHETNSIFETSRTSVLDSSQKLKISEIQKIGDFLAFDFRGKSK